jgi:hypothetical protein
MVFDVDEDDINIVETVSVQRKKDVRSSVVPIHEEPDGDWMSSVAESESYLSEDDDLSGNDDKDDTTGEPGSTADNTDSNSSPLTEMQRYAAMENKLVNRWRRIVIVSILLTGALVGGITFSTLNTAQNNDSSDAVRSLSLILLN